MREYYPDIQDKIEQLPPEQRSEVEDFVEFLLSRGSSGEGSSEETVSLRGIWQGSEIDENLIDEAARSVFRYEDR